MKRGQKQTGFTIVELLIVIVVIAILAAIAVVAYNGVQQRSRDSIRKNDITALGKALELHYIDKGSYTQPEAACGDFSIGFDHCNGTTDYVGDWHSSSNLRSLIADGYTKSLPKDPINNSTYKYNYEPWNAGDGGYATAGQAYDLCATLEAGGTFCVSKRK